MKRIRSELLCHTTSQKTPPKFAFNFDVRWFCAKFYMCKYYARLSLLLRALVLAVTDNKILLVEGLQPISRTNLMKCRYFKQMRVGEKDCSPTWMFPMIVYN